MGLSELDEVVLFYCQQGVAESTRKTYATASRAYARFCNDYNVPVPFPTTEYIMCCFVSSLAARDLSAGTIKTYIAGVKFEQISRGFPSPPLALSWARLRLVQAGIARSQAARSHRARLPITPDILRQLRHGWFRVPNPEVSVLWAVAVLAFFGFFRLGELLVAGARQFDPCVHLAWGDVSIDSRESPSIVKVHLKRSKCDQLQRGVDIFVGLTGDVLCPIAA